MNGEGSGDALPDWRRVLVVVAHPDDESFGLGGVIDSFVRVGAQVMVHCFSQGEASTLHAVPGELREIRRGELAAAAQILGVSAVHLSEHPDGLLSERMDDLIAEVDRAVADARPDGVLIFHRDGVTGHPDHVAAGLAAIDTARRHDIGVLEWTLPASVADVMNAETGGSFSGWAADEIDLVIEVDRQKHRQAIAAHASQATPDSPLWRRLELLGTREYLQLNR